MLAPDLNKGDLRLKSVLCDLSQEVRNVISICSAEQGACCLLFNFFSDSFVSDLNRFTPDLNKGDLRHTLLNVFTSVGIFFQKTRKFNVHIL